MNQARFDFESYFLHSSRCMGDIQVRYPTERFTIKGASKSVDLGFELHKSRRTTEYF